jgi:WS/DGAT/MGAT family acyltransferase
MTYREQMSSVDTAWLRMDRPSNLMMICGVLVFRDRVDLARLRTTIEEGFLKYRRFRQRPVHIAGVWFWEDDAEFDLEQHLLRVGLPGDAGQRELQGLVSDLIATPLDPAKPMWQYHLVERFGEGSALILRIHHCYADGIALIQVMMSMTASSADEAISGAGGRKSSRKHGGEGLDALLTPIQGLLRTATRWGSALVEKGGEILSDPGRAVLLAEQGSALTTELLQLATMGEDSRTRFKGRPGVAKRVAWAEPISLDEVKAVGKALGASVNDVLMSSVAGAMRSYLVGRGDSVDDVVIRAAVPVNLRPLEKAYQLGNRFGLVMVDLPIGVENPIARLYQVRANMQALKGSYQPVLVLALLAAVGAGPKVLQDQILSVMTRYASVVMTNVPGPQQRRYMAGAEIESLMVWVPQTGDIGIGVSIISYNGKVQFGLVADRRLCPDPEKVIAGFAPEFEKLLFTALMAPWEGTLEPGQAEAIVARMALRSGRAAATPARTSPVRRRAVPSRRRAGT